MKGKNRIYGLIIFVACTGVGALLAYFLFDFKPPGGLIILMGSVMGYVISLALFPAPPEKSIRMHLEFREDGRWPIIRKVSCIFFFLFFCLAGLFSSPKLIQPESLRRGLFLLFSGLGLLSGTPVMFAWKNRLNLLGYCSLFISLMLSTTGLFHIFDIKIPPIHKISLLAFGMAVPLLIVIIVLTIQRRRK